MKIDKPMILTIIAVILIAIFGMVFGSCTKYTCPTYAKYDNEIQV